MLNTSDGNSTWFPFDEGRTTGQVGSEKGVIKRDEQHSAGGRITLERDTPTAPFAITCGIYHWLVHTRFFSTEGAAQQAYEEMKTELARILRLIPDEGDPEEKAKIEALVPALKDFVRRFP